MAKVSFPDGGHYRGVPLYIFNQLYIVLIQDVLSISEGIDGSVNSYTFNLTYSNLKCGRISNSALLSFCESEVCSYKFDQNNLLHCFDDSTQVVVTVFASNVLGDGLPSQASQNIGNYIYTCS